MALRNHIRVVLIMIDDIIEGTDGTEEIAFMELRLTEPQPRQMHVLIELLGLEPEFIFGIVRPFGVTFGFRLDRVQLDALAAFIDGFVHLRGRSLRRSMVRYRIEVQHAAVVIRVGIADGLQAFLVRDVAVIENIIFDFRLMERPGRPCIFLGRARDKRGYG